MVLPNPGGLLSKIIIPSPITEAVNKSLEKVVNVHMKSGGASTNDNNRAGNK